MDINLRPDERVLVAAKIHWITYTRGILIALAVLLLSISGGVATFRNNQNVPASVALVWIILFAVGLLPILIRWLENSAISYIVTNQRIFKQEGLLEKFSSDIPLGKINDVSMYQSVLQRIVGAGDVTVLTGNDVATSFRNLADPVAFRDSIAKTR